MTLYPHIMVCRQFITALLTGIIKKILQPSAKKKTQQKKECDWNIKRKSSWNIFSLLANDSSFSHRQLFLFPRTSFAYTTLMGILAKWYTFFHSCWKFAGIEEEKFSLVLILWCTHEGFSGVSLLVCWCVVKVLIRRYFQDGWTIKSKRSVNLYLLKQQLLASTKKVWNVLMGYNRFNVAEAKMNKHIPEMLMSIVFCHAIWCLPFNVW